jgi:hypothetical protein
MERIKYKPPLTIDEQIEYLKNTKHVVFIEITEEKAKNEYSGVRSPVVRS